MKRAKTLYLTKDMPKTGTYYRSGYKINDNNNDYLIYHKNKAKYHIDIPIEKNDIGIIVNGYFILIFKSHPYTLDMQDKINECQEQITKNFMNLRDLGIELIRKTRRLKV